MIIRGQTSGAEATILSVDLISDEVGSLTGSFKVPDPTVSGQPRFETGRSTLRLTNSKTNSQIMDQFNHLQNLYSIVRVLLMYHKILLYLLEMLKLK